jgi:murein L,D-transpeptidase YcbB/YkuD
MAPWRAAAAKIAAMIDTQTVRRLATALAMTVAAALAQAQELDELIRMRVEQLRATGLLEIGGEPIAARNLLPRIYENRGFTPAWGSVAQIDALLELLDESYLEGLDPEDYHATAVRAARSTLTSFDALPPVERAGLDLLLTDSVIRLGYHLRFGKVDPVELDANWNETRELMGEDPAITLQRAIDSPSLRDFAAEVIPRAFLYDRFKAALARYRAIAAAGGWPEVPRGPSLKPATADDRVPVLAARLAATGDLPAEAALAATGFYDGAIVEGLRTFQSRHGLMADGVVGPATLAALNVPVAARIDQIRANLDRARWVLYDPERDFIVVNIAGFGLYIVRRGEVVWRTRVQVGRPYRQTPVFRAEMTYLVLNPNWTVPPTIFREDVLPQVRRDSSYLATRNIDLKDLGGQAVDPASVDWSGARSFPYQLVQRPGPDNALGRIKFMFPNAHFVYLHDTPSRELFERDSRAFSSGCIRVENPLELAQQILGSKWSRERLDSMLATRRTETVFLDEPISVMLLYWTTEPSADGRVTFFPDVYNRDPTVIAALARPFDARDVL